MYTISVDPKAVPKAIQILGDMVSSLKNVSEESVSKVRGQVLNQKKAVESDKYLRSMDHLYSTMYQQDTMGFTKEGPSANIKSLNAADLSDYASKLYVNENMSIGVTGSDFDVDSAWKIVQQAFNSSGSVAVSSKPHFFGSTVTDRNDNDEDSVLVTFAFDGLAKQSKELHKLLVVKELVGEFSKFSGAGDTHSSNLAEHVATERLANSFFTFNQSYSDSGFFGITLASHGRLLDDLCVGVISEFVRFAHNARPNEVQRAVTKYKNIVLAQDDGSAFMSKKIASANLSGFHVPTLKEQIESISSINENSIRALCRNHFMDVEPVVVGVGSTRLVPDYNQIRGYTHWWRI